MTDLAISLCMIVRNEAEWLGRCLDSASGVFDELVVVDTGSTDGTAELAQAAGARVFHFPWGDDFAAARNRSLESARGEWILVLDADEALWPRRGVRSKLLALANSGAPAGQVEIVSEVPGGRSSCQTTRFFPRHPAVRYTRRVHEQLTRDGRPLVGWPTGVRVEHFGYSAELVTSRSKLVRNETLLRAQLLEYPEDSHDWYQLGRTLELGERFEEALEAYQRAVEFVSDDDPHLPHLFECAATCLRAMDRSPQALEWLSQVEPVFSERADTVFLVALLAMDVGQLARAERGFQRCLELGRAQAGNRLAGAPGGAAQTSETARGSAPAHNLGVLFECTERPDQAREAYQLALEFDPKHEGARAGLARLAGSSGPPGPLGPGRSEEPPQAGD